MPVYESMWWISFGFEVLTSYSRMRMCMMFFHHMECVNVIIIDDKCELIERNAYKYNVMDDASNLSDISVICY